MFFRLFLKNWLRILSKWALRKHRIQLVVVAGWYGTEVTRELVYNVLGTKYTVRRITKNPWWDFSIPLSILGYKDERRNLFAWIWLLIRSVLRLAFGRSNPHILVLNLNYSEPETTKYWSGFVRPDLLVITSYKDNIRILKKVIRNTVAKNGILVFNYKDIAPLKGMIGSYEHIFTFGDEEQSDLKYQRSPKGTLEFIYKKQNFNMQKALMWGIKSEMVAGALSVAVLKDVPVLDALYAMVKYPMPQKLLAKLKIDLLT